MLFRSGLVVALGAHRLVALERACPSPALRPHPPPRPSIPDRPRARSPDPSCLLSGSLSRQLWSPAGICLPSRTERSAATPSRAKKRTTSVGLGASLRSRGGGRRGRQPVALSLEPRAPWLSWAGQAAGSPDPDHHPSSAVNWCVILGKSPPLGAHSPPVTSQGRTLLV